MNKLNLHIKYQFYNSFDVCSVKVLYNDMIINLLIAKEDIVYDTWVYATNEYIRIVGNLTVPTKYLRVSLFSNLKALYLANVK